MALVNGDYFHYTEMNKFLKKKCLQSFDPSINMAVVNGGFLHYTDVKKLLKSLPLRNHWSDFEIISYKCPLSYPFQKLFTKF